MMKKEMRPAGMRIEATCSGSTVIAEIAPQQNYLIVRGKTKGSRPRSQKAEEILRDALQREGLRAYGGARFGEAIFIAPTRLNQTYSDIAGGIERAMESVVACERRRAIRRKS